MVGSDSPDWRRESEWEFGEDPWAPVMHPAAGGEADSADWRNQGWWNLAEEDADAPIDVPGSD